MEAEFRSLLSGDADIAALVGARIYPNTVPQNATDPCVAIYKISSVTGVHMGGSDRLTTSTFQIDIRTSATVSGATPVDQMYAIRDAIVAKLHCFNGIVDNVWFQGIFLNNERQTSEKPGTVLYHRCSLDFNVITGLVT